LNNAIHYTPEGGEIIITSQHTDDFIEISVQDTGSGISPEHLPHIFERFYRADQSRSRKTGGAGLGLAIVKHLVEAQGGQVSAVSQPGQGTTISFTLPVAQDSWVTDEDEAALPLPGTKPNPSINQHPIL
jgi:signal transduction histidine kinase